MKRISLFFLMIVLIAGRCYGQPAPVVRVQPSTPGPAFSPAVSEVVKLAQSGVGDEVVVAYVKNSAVRFNLTADDIVALKNSGVSESAISAMLTRDKSLPNNPVPLVVSPPAQSTARAQPPSAIPNSGVVPPAVTVPDAPYVTNAPLVPVAPQSTVVEQAPPATRVEVVPTAPGPNYYWVPGYWSWNGTWVWMGGRWVVRPWHTAVWVPGHWSRHGRGYIWIRGHWR